MADKDNTARASERIAAPADRVHALETLMQDRNLIPSGYFESFQHTVEHEWVPQNGARVVARAWVDPAFRARLLVDGKAAVEEMGIPFPPQHKHLVVLANTPVEHNVIVCTLCSCTAFTLIGVAPGWYKDFEYRSRIVRQARSVLAEMGVKLEESIKINVWDTTTDTRYMVMPMRPAGTEHLSESELAALVTKESLIGVACLEEKVNVELA